MSAHRAKIFANLALHGIREASWLITDLQRPFEREKDFFVVFAFHDATQTHACANIAPSSSAHGELLSRVFEFVRSAAMGEAEILVGG